MMIQEAVPGTAASVGKGKETDPVKNIRLAAGGVLLALAGLIGPAAVGDWQDNFDSYALGGIHGVGGWKGWDNSAAATGFVVDSISRSALQSQQVYGATDSVHEYSGYTSGRWIYTAYQYIPEGFSGTSYFIMLNTYTDVVGPNNWSVQVAFNSSTGLVANEGAGGGSMPYVTGRWVPVRCDINLDTDELDIYYDNALLSSSTWTGGMSGGGALNIGAVDLFANNASSVYYDDLSLLPFTVIPEPAAAAFAALGTLGALRRRRR